jgi:hypothetical protein
MPEPLGKKIVVEKTKKTLLQELNLSGVTLQQKRGCTKAELQGLARVNRIETVNQVDKLQVLCKRGLLDPTMSDKYTLDRKKDTILGKCGLQYSLCSLMSEFLDLKE